MSDRIGSRPAGATAVLMATLTLALVCVGAWRIVTYDPRPTSLDAAPASASRDSANPDDRYFAGTPAVGWADDAAGFTLPAAAALNGVGEPAVAAGYALLVRLMTAGNLDAKILDGGQVTDFTNLLDPHSGLAAELESRLAHPSRQDDPTVLLTRFDPATTRLLGHTVKVHGTMSAAVGPRPDTVLLTADYDFVYAVTTPSGAGGEVQRVTVHRTVQLEVLNPDDFVTVPGKAWLYDYAADLSDIRCYDYDGFVEPGFNGGGVPDMTGVADPYATGNLLTGSAAPRPSETGGVCRAVDGD
jgi:hypothetical protein